MIKLKVKHTPKGIWLKEDFKINLFFWKKNHSKYPCEEIRINNLIDINRIFSKHKKLIWLQGKTLVGIYKHRRLFFDNDDDFGIFSKDVTYFNDLIIPELTKLGFKVIRANENMISLERNYRYIDVCIFSLKSNNQVGYSLKVFDKSHFKNFDEISFKNEKFKVPSKTNQLIDILENYRRPRKITIRKIYNKASILFNIYKYKIIEFNLDYPKWFLYVLNIKMYYISKEEFLNLKIEPDNSYNWVWRKNHLDLVTNFGKCKKIDEIVEFFSKKENILDVDNQVIETDTKKIFYHPINSDMDFWWNGNNFFWYCIKFGFRKNVVPYSKANEYIKKGLSPSLYSSKYYESLAPLSDFEIQNSFEKQPIEIKNNSVLGGKHRVFAMIGRLINGKDYIPIRVIDLDHENFV
jgi:hypothetical protein